MPTSPLKTTTATPGTAPKLPQGIRNLRDAEDVFPSFATFHKNLRTHYLRHRISEDVLVFGEEENDDSLNGDTLHETLSMVQHNKGDWKAN